MVSGLWLRAGLSLKRGPPDIFPGPRATRGPNRAAQLRELFWAPLTAVKLWIGVMGFEWEIS